MKRHSKLFTSIAWTVSPPELKIKRPGNNARRRENETPLVYVFGFEER
ncbi:MAG: hypothetical protein N3G20_04515 [Verrucomicrobiae bacterium]|nr:hypothetical protein [Verrucomicrobiae bacterium]